MRPSEIDFGALTHLAQFSVVPRQDGSLDASTNLMTQANIRAAVLAGHESGIKALFTVGGRGSREAFLSAMNPPHRDFFIGSLIAFMDRHGYDGIDLDMEEILPADGPAYSDFVRALRAELDKTHPSALLTAAVLWEPELFAALAEYFDQINLMTYNLSGPYPGWVVWHSGALRDGGQSFPDGETPLPSVEGLVRKFLEAGVPAAKLGIGMSFNGYIWTGAGIDRPRQRWENAPVMSIAPYHLIADQYRVDARDPRSPGYHWDSRAQAPYLSLPAKNPAESQFVSFQNGETAARMIEFIREKGLGGMILWDLSAGYRPGKPRGIRDELLQSVKRAREAGTP